jgi:hypothetical protein
MIEDVAKHARSASESNEIRFDADAVLQWVAECRAYRNKTREAERLENLPTIGDIMKKLDEE